MRRFSRSSPPSLNGAQHVIPHDVISFQQQHDYLTQQHTDQRDPRTPYVLNTPDQIFQGRNGGGISIFFFYGPD